MQISRRALSFSLGLSLPFISNFVYAASTSNEDKKFEKIAKDWLENMLRTSPVQATQIGDHRFDSMIDDMSEEGRNNSLKYSKSVLVKISKIKKINLSRANQIDYNLLENSLKSTIFNIETVKEWSWNPLSYQAVAGGAIYNLMAREFAPLETRLLNSIDRLGNLPNIFSSIRSQIDAKKVPTPHAKTYAAQHKGIMGVWNDMVKPHLKNLPQNAQDIAKKNEEKFINAALIQQKWIDDILLPNAKGDFRVGSKIFDKALGFALMSDLTRIDIKQKALERIKMVRAQMFEIAKNFYPEPIPVNPDEATIQKIIQNAINKAAEARPERNALVETSTAMTEIARKFVIEKDLITLPDGPVKVILMPEFQRGYAVAYCDSPGPLDKNLATYYAVSPIPDDWTNSQSDSFLKEYNMRGIQDIAVHEAMPGHYVQLFHANKNSSILRSILSSGSFIEGWAVYAEQVMVEEGFKQDDPLYKLTQLKVQLRTITNALIDQAIHCEGMSEDEMMELLTKTAFQEESEARGKWRRAQLSYTQLSTYFVGFLEHMDTRESYKAKMGSKFNLKQYHDKVLSFGSPPMKYAKALLLEKPIK